MRRAAEKQAREDSLLGIPCFLLATFHGVSGNLVALAIWCLLHSWWRILMRQALRFFERWGYSGGMGVQYNCESRSC